MPNTIGRVFQLLTNGATIVKAKGVGYVIVEPGGKRRRARRTKRAKKTVAA